MWPDRVLNQGPLALESDPLPTALCGLAICTCIKAHAFKNITKVTIQSHVLVSMFNSRTIFQNQQNNLAKYFNNFN